MPDAADTPMTCLACGQVDHADYFRVPPAAPGYYRCPDCGSGRVSGPVPAGHPGPFTAAELAAAARASGPGRPLADVLADLRVYRIARNPSTESE